MHPVRRRQSNRPDGASGADLDNSPRAATPGNTTHTVGPSAPPRAASEERIRAEATPKRFPWEGLFAAIAAIATICAIPTLPALIAFVFALPACLLAALAWHRGGRWSWIWLFAAGTLVVAAVALLAASVPHKSGDSTSGTFDTNATTNSSTSTLPEQSSSSTPTPTMSAPSATTIPALAGPRPVTVALKEGQTHEFFDGRLLVGNQSTYSSGATLTLSTRSNLCHPDPKLGDFITVGSPSDGYFRVTLLATSAPQVTVRAESVSGPAESLLSYTCS